MTLRRRQLLVVVLGLLALASWGPSRPGAYAAPGIPHPEHPRPDSQRADGQNLNGPWSLRFDPENAGEEARWMDGAVPFPETITVSFPWGSRLSGVEDGADVAWYAREVTVSESWRGRRVFLMVGACDWKTDGWLDGQPLGTHRGGYTRFELELTPYVEWGRPQRLTLRVDDTPHPFKLEGKQGYGNARGIWQTAYLEARAPLHMKTLHLTPDLSGERVMAKAELSDPAPAGTRLEIHVQGSETKPDGVVQRLDAGAREVELSVGVPEPHLWSLEDPFLYDIEAILVHPDGTRDVVAGYFGMREIGVVDLPGHGYPYVALNGRPVYLRLTLDQAYHPDGFYTFPDDGFVRGEIERAKRIGLNGIRIHVKIDSPRKLYWAGRLGLLVMADVPNAWGPPDAEKRRESEAALRGMIRRDYNHPAIFSWVLFHETWGLQSGDEKVYLPETQEWVASMYRLARSLDPTRLVEDNSPCNHDHVVTDLNSWHAYLPGYAWRDHLAEVVAHTSPGSTWNYIGGRRQARAPLVNSECGNVWGYEGSTGDVDWSFDYHLMMDAFRRQPKIGGFLYTEHHDVINEWNGYYRYDRSAKMDGLSELVPGMSLNDLHAPFYLSPGPELCTEVRPGATVTVPLWASFLTDQAPAGPLRLRADLRLLDDLGREVPVWRTDRPVPFEAWMSREIEPLEARMPFANGLAILSLVLEDAAGNVLHRNFTTFLLGDGPAPRDERRAVDGKPLRLLRVAPADLAAWQWSQKQWSVLDGLKVDGAGAGFFEYRIPWPGDLAPDQVATASLLAELSAKQLFGKDREGAQDLPSDRPSEERDAGKAESGRP